jgi:hypothetical protein
MGTVECEKGVKGVERIGCVVEGVDVDVGGGFGVGGVGVGIAHDIKLKIINGMDGL